MALGCDPDGCCWADGVEGLELGAGMAHPAPDDASGAGGDEAVDEDDCAGIGVGVVDGEVSAAAIAVDGGFVRSLKQ